MLCHIITHHASYQHPPSPLLSSPNAQLLGRSDLKAFIDFFGGVFESEQKSGTLQHYNIRMYVQITVTFQYDPYFI